MTGALFICFFFEFLLGRDEREELAGKITARTSPYEQQYTTAVQQLLLQQNLWNCFFVRLFIQQQK